MIFVFPITIPASTPVYAPVIQPLQLAAGKISLVMIQFPSGVNALAHITLSDGLHQLFPTNQDGDFATGAETVIWDEDEDFDLIPYTLTATAWNDDATYAHTLTVRIVIQKISKPADLTAEMAKLLAQGTPGHEGPATYPVTNP